MSLSPARFSASWSSGTIVHQPTENGWAEPQSIDRSLFHPDGTANGRMTCRDSLQQSKKAPSIADQSPSSHALTSPAEPTTSRRLLYLGSRVSRILLSVSRDGITSNLWISPSGNKRSNTIGLAGNGCSL